MSAPAVALLAAFAIARIPVIPGALTFAAVVAAAVGTGDRASRSHRERRLGRGGRPDRIDCSVRVMRSTSRRIRSTTSRAVSPRSTRRPSATSTTSPSSRAPPTRAACAIAWPRSRLHSPRSAPGRSSSPSCPTTRTGRPTTARPSSGVGSRRRSSETPASPRFRAGPHPDARACSGPPPAQAPPTGRLGRRRPRPSASSSPDTSRRARERIRSASRC